MKTVRVGAKSTPATSTDLVCSPNGGGNSSSGTMIPTVNGNNPTTLTRAEQEELPPVVVIESADHMLYTLPRTLAFRMLSVQTRISNGEGVLDSTSTPPTMRLFFPDINSTAMKKVIEYVIYEWRESDVASALIPRVPGSFNQEQQIAQAAREAEAEALFAEKAAEEQRDPSILERLAMTDGPKVELLPRPAESMFSYLRNSSSAILCELASASFYLDVKPLVEATCRSIAGLIRGKSAEEIRETFSITNDFTPAEEEAVGRSIVERALLLPAHVIDSDHGAQALLSAPIPKARRVIEGPQHEIKRNKMKAKLQSKLLANQQEPAQPAQPDRSVDELMALIEEHPKDKKKKTKKPTPTAPSTVATTPLISTASMGPSPPAALAALIEPSSPVPQSQQIEDGEENAQNAAAGSTAGKKKKKKAKKKTNKDGENENKSNDQEYHDGQSDAATLSQLASLLSPTSPSKLDALNNSFRNLQLLQQRVANKSTATIELEEDAVSSDDELPSANASRTVSNASAQSDSQLEPLDPLYQQIIEGSKSTKERILQKVYGDDHKSDEHSRSNSSTVDHEMDEDLISLSQAEALVHEIDAKLSGLDSLDKAMMEEDVQAFASYVRTCGTEGASIVLPSTLSGIIAANANLANAASLQQPISRPDSPVQTVTTAAPSSSTTKSTSSSVKPRSSSNASNSTAADTASSATSSCPNHGTGSGSCTCCTTLATILPKLQQRLSTLEDTNNANAQKFADLASFQQRLASVENSQKQAAKSLAERMKVLEKFEGQLKTLQGSLVKMITEEKAARQHSEEILRTSLENKQETLERIVEELKETVTTAAATSAQSASNAANEQKQRLQRLSDRLNSIEKAATSAKEDQEKETKRNQQRLEKLVTQTVAKELASNKSSAAGPTNRGNDEEKQHYLALSKKLEQQLALLDQARSQQQQQIDSAVIAAMSKYAAMNPHPQQQQQSSNSLLSNNHYSSSSLLARDNLGGSSLHSVFSSNGSVPTHTSLSNSWSSHQSSNSNDTDLYPFARSAANSVTASLLDDDEPLLPTSSASTTDSGSTYFSMFAPPGPSSLAPKLGGSNSNVVGAPTNTTHGAVGSNSFLSRGAKAFNPPIGQTRLGSLHQ